VLSSPAAVLEEDGDSDETVQTESDPSSAPNATSQALPPDNAQAQSIAVTAVPPNGVKEWSNWRLVCSLVCTRLQTLHLPSRDAVMTFWESFVQLKRRRLLYTEQDSNQKIFIVKLTMHPR
jgi:hypothetical protein